MTESNYHKSVLYRETLEALSVVPGEVYLDGTFGGGGHTKGILDLGGKVIALDFDRDALENATRNFELKKENGYWEAKDGNLKIFQENFKNLDKVASKLDLEFFSGILFDLGASSFMFDNPERGFSFNKEGQLDMRMDQDLQVKALDLVNALNEGELYELFTKFGQEPYGRRIARSIVQSRMNTKINTTTQLAEIIKEIYPTRTKINPATRVFMALRIAVNDELNNLKEALPKAAKLLKTGGRLVVISFHSLEDKIVKDYFKNDLDLKILTNQPIVALENELSENQRARSAKLRVAEKL